MSRPASPSGFVKTNPAIQLIALLALLIGALAPSGFMPVQTEQGFAIKLCSGHPDNQLAITPDHPDYALLAMVFGNSQAPSEESQSDQTTPTCAFAGGSPQGLASAAPEIANNPLAPAAHEPTEPRRFALRNRINIPPATGPPVTV